MKKILSALVLITFGYCAISQSLKNSVVSANLEVPAVSNASEPSSTIPLNKMNTKAVRDFKQTFQNVTDEKWYDMPDGYRAKFTLSNISYRLDYDKKGNWLHTIRYYDEKNLPVEVRSLVAASYLDYRITTVEEIEAPRGTTFYVIHLEGQANWINIKVADNEINELQTIKKS